MSYYKTNRLRAKTRNTEPSLTDQSGAKDADINVIVGRFLKTGTAPGSKLQPMFGDFTGLPTSLAEFIWTARGLETTREKLPEQLRKTPIEELLSLTTEDLKKILTPVEKTEEKKE